MNYYAARQREKDKRWDFTVMNDKRIRPVGYCRPYEPLSSSLMPQQVVEQHNSEYGRFQKKYHDDGHATAEEACNCYREYELDNHLRFGKISLDEAKSKRQALEYCEAIAGHGICGEVTASAAWIAGSISSRWNLCWQHLNRESVDGLFSVGEIWSS